MPEAFLACSASRVLELNTKIEPNLNGSIKNNVDGGLSWICFTLGKFCFCNFVAISSIFSLSGLTSCHPSANPLEPRPNFVRWCSAPLTQTLYSSYNNVDGGTWTPTALATCTSSMRVYHSTTSTWLVYLVFNLYFIYSLRGGSCLKDNPLEKWYLIIFLRQSTTLTQLKLS